MNDTFDDFTFADLPVFCSNNVDSAAKSSTSSDKVTKNEISFDDSMFFNVSDLTIVKNQENVTVTDDDDDIFSGSEPPRKPQIITHRLSDQDIFALESENQHFNSPKKEIFNDSAEIIVPRPPDQDIFALELKNKKQQSLKLSTWGLPTSILEKYESRNVATMFQWQVDCLNNPKILKEHSNLLYSAPTSAGKTLVAEILAIKTVLERRKKVIFILPFVSVVREKMFYFQDIFSGSGVRVEGFMGSYSPPGGIKAVQMAVCTIEKANNIVNSFLKEGNMSEIGAVVIDELHLLGEPHRGYILELLLTKLRYISSKDQSVDIQIIGMSATLPNLDSLAKWLDAQLFVTNFRPIPLYERAIVGGDIYDDELKLVRHLETHPELDTDTDNILQLCLETIGDCCSVLIFCPTKNWCENLAQQIAQAFWKLGSKSESDICRRLREQLKTEAIGEVLEQLRGCPVGLDGVLRRTVSFGVAFHHAGLTMDERDIIEGAFRNGAVRVLVATSTLSSGVNLPARRVIIRTPIFHGKPLDALSYRQMAGRAGRMGKDTAGESILVCQKNDRLVAKSLMGDKLRPIESCLEGGGKLHRALLEVIASGVATSPEDITLFTKCTLLAQSEAEQQHPIDDALQFLQTNEFVRLQDQQYVATSLGAACLSSSVAPEEGLALFTELEKARKCFVLETELHLIYLVTPFTACHQWGNIDWMFYLDLYEKLPPGMKKVGELVGIRESFIVSATRGKLQANSHRKLLVHKRFFVALALQDLVNEVPLGEVCQKFGCNRGTLQSLQLTASTFAGMVTSFSKQLGWSSVEILISQFQDRLQFGINRDLLDLMRLPLLNGKTARALYDGGIETLVALANCDVSAVENVLHKVAPFQSGKVREGESEHDLKERNKLKNIWITGKQGLTEREAAELLLNSARDYLRMEMGLKEAKWNESKSVETTHNRSVMSDCSLFETSGDIIGTSQDESYVSFLEKTPKLSRKRTMNSDRLLLECQSPSKKTKLSQHSQQMQEFEIVDVCANAVLFSTFCEEVMREAAISLAVACKEAVQKTRVIGLTPDYSTGTSFSHKNKCVAGFAISWGSSNIVYYLDLTKMAACTDLVKSLISCEQKTVKMFESKEQIKALKLCCRLDFRASIEDPKVGDWILDPEGRVKSFQAMVRIYCKKFTTTANLCGIASGSPSLEVQSPVDPKLRSCIDSYLTWHLTDAVKTHLRTQSAHLLSVFGTEMASVRVLSRMEIVGLGASTAAFQNLIETLNTEQANIEKKAYSLAGKRFSLVSSKDVARVLRVPKTDTKKRSLEKNSHPLARLVLQWRKLNSIVTKTVLPLARSVEGGRIHGCCDTHTATGRITMHEPNLQNVAKSFDIGNIRVSCRNAFVAREGCVLVSADYCQLELRLLAHLSRDRALGKVMRGQGDVFRKVAAQWNKIEESEVTDDLRQKSKQICYGIIYGMGNKALAEQLNIREEEAADLMYSFRSAYPGVQKYIEEIVEGCRERGYVETLAGRRRYLPHISNRSLALRSQAERQAVNTTVQGSAADLVKNAMVTIDKEDVMDKGINLVLHLHDELMFEVSKDNVDGFAHTLKKKMEESVNLSIPFPVKLKSGGSWGEMIEYNL